MDKKQYPDAQGGLKKPDPSKADYRGTYSPSPTYPVPQEPMPTTSSDGEMLTSSELEQLRRVKREQGEQALKAFRRREAGPRVAPLATGFESMSSKQLEAEKKKSKRKKT